MNGFEIIMTLNDVTPLTERQLLIPGNITFKKLHEIISLVFNIECENRYQFLFSDINMVITETNSLNRDMIDSRYEKITKYFQAFSSITYKNNFWTVNISINEKSYEENYPQILSFKGVYNPFPEISSVKEFNYLLNMKNGVNPTWKELLLINKFMWLNKLTLQKQLMDLFDIHYVVKNRKIIAIKNENTLDDLLKR